MNYLGIDFGEAKIGLALGSDETGLALPIDIIYYREVVDALAQIRDILVSDSIDKIVLGQPRKLSGADMTSERLKEFEEKLHEFNCPIVMEDERFSTGVASSLKKAFNFSSGDDDSVAAAAILQNYLDRERHGKNV